MRLIILSFVSVAITLNVFANTKKCSPELLEEKGFPTNSIFVAPTVSDNELMRSAYNKTMGKNSEIRSDGYVVIESPAESYVLATPTCEMIRLSSTKEIIAKTTLNTCKFPAVIMSGEEFLNKLNPPTGIAVGMAICDSLKR